MMYNALFLLCPLSLGYYEEGGGISCKAFQTVQYRDYYFRVWSSKYTVIHFFGGLMFVLAILSILSLHSIFNDSY